MGFLELQRQCGVSHEVLRGAQGASHVVLGKSGLHWDGLWPALGRSAESSSTFHGWNDQSFLRGRGPPCHPAGSAVLWVSEADFLVLQGALLPPSTQLSTLHLWGGLGLLSGDWSPGSQCWEPPGGAGTSPVTAGVPQTHSIPREIAG